MNKSILDFLKRTFYVHMYTIPCNVAQSEKHSQRCIPVIGTHKYGGRERTLEGIKVYTELPDNLQMSNTREM